MSLIKKEPVDEEDLEEPEEDLESVWVKTETVVVTPDQVNLHNDKPTNLTQPQKPKKQLNRKTRQCPQCDYTTIHGNSLKYHMLTHSDERPQTCQYCEFSTKWPPILTRHMNTIHADMVVTNIEPEMYTCTLCDYKTTIKINLKAHNRKHKMEKQYKCDVCSYETAYKHSFIKHNKKHQDNVYQCDKCMFETKYHGHITRHMEQIHNEIVGMSKHVCEFCNTTSKEKWKLKRHKERSRQTNVLICMVCNFQTFYQCQMRKHKTTHFGTGGEGSGQLSPTMLQKVAEQVELMEKSIANETLYECDKCSFATKFKGHMTRHLDKLHNEVIKTNFVCHLCSTGFTDNYKLKQHKTLSLTKEVDCNMCNFKTVYKCAYRRHMVVEHGGVGNKNSEMEIEVPPNKSSQSVCEEKQIDIEEEQCSGGNNPTLNAEDGVFICNKCNYRTLQADVMSNHIAKAHNVSEPTNADLEQDIASMLNDSLGANLVNKSNTETQNEPTTQCYSDNSTDHALQSSHTQISQNKFGKYLIDRNCVDWQTIQVIETSGSKHRYKCPLCDFPSKFKACVQKHFQRRHTDRLNRPYKCINCDFTTKTKDAISLHNKRNPFINTMSCKNCDYTTNYKCAYTSHQKQHYLFKCTFCTSTYKQKYEFIKHIGTKHLGKGVKCRFCDYVSLRRDTLASHELTHGGIRPFTCSECEFSTARRTFLYTHMKARHNIDVRATNVKMINESKIESLKTPESKIESLETPENKIESSRPPKTEVATEKEFVCVSYEPNDPLTAATDSSNVDQVHVKTDIEINFIEDIVEEDVKPDISQLDINIKSSPSSPESSAPDISTEFLSIPPLDSDQEVDDTPNTTKIFACDHCDFTTPIKTKLIAHIRRKHDSKLYKFTCSLCPFKTSRRMYLMKHRKIHKSTSVFKCNLCNYKTKSKGFVMKHLQCVHKKIVKSKYTCVYCNFACVDRHKLKTHQQKTIMDKVSKCTLCHFKTLFKCQMKKHKLHHQMIDKKDDILTETAEADMYTEEQNTKKASRNTDQSDSDSSSENVLKCDDCPFTTEDENAIMIHRFKVHNGCKYCGRCFDHQLDLKDHMQNNKSDNGFKCFFCDFESDYKCEICRHISSYFTAICGPGGADVQVQNKIASMIDSLPETDEVKNEYDNSAENKDTGIGLRMEKNKFGHFFSDPNCLDMNSFRVQKSDDLERPYKCPICDFSSKFRHSLQKHAQRNHSDDRPYRCVDCGFATKTKDSIRKHYSRKISHKTLSCSKCGFKADVKCTMARHVKIHYRHKCLICKRNFHNKNMFITHFAVTHLKIGFRCRICTAFFAMTEKALAEHESIHNEKPFQCDLCEYSARRKSLLRNHIERQHTHKIKNETINKIEKEETTRCDLCDFVAQDQKKLTAHRKRKHMTKYMCEYCSYTTPYKRALETHSNTHHLKDRIHNNDTANKIEMDFSETIKCDLCDFVAQGQDKLTAHIKRKHMSAYMCEFCSYTTPYKGALKTHSKIHSKSLMYTCKKCPYETTYKGRIVGHLERVHHEKVEERKTKLLCEFCGEKQRSFYMLKVHQEKNRCENAMQCNLCSFDTLYRCQMVKHANSHFDADNNKKNMSEQLNDPVELSYTVEIIKNEDLKCRFCDFVTSKKEDLTVHEATHTGENPFKCDLCHHAYKTRVLLNFHWKKCHS